MGTPAGLFTSVFNHVAKPITALEFKEAIEATCRPRFPAAAQARPRPIALAISGGVDSMALAFLWLKMCRMFPHLKIGDNPVSASLAVVVDHAIRPETATESLRVARELNIMGYKTIHTVLKWYDSQGERTQPQCLPNLESMARTLRYQQLARTCVGLHTSSLFTAHHQDDQYETILMRLISGQGYRGIQGMKVDNDIPESHGVYGGHKSGLLEDQRAKYPFLSFKPSARDMRTLKQILKEDRNGEDRKPVEAWDSIDGMHFHGHVPVTQESGVPDLVPLECEDGGIRVYRPLLGFGKDRLTATCEANNIQWFEDPSNKDETMTMRNAIRHLVANYTLPRALQKPEVLALSARAKRRADSEEAEAHRHLRRKAVIQEFDSCVGTLVIQLPDMTSNHRRCNRLYARAENEARRSHQKVIAALMIRTLIEYVTPNEHLPSLRNLDTVVHRLFPELNPVQTPYSPFAFSMSDVIFDPVVRRDTVKWFLSRAPYHSRRPLPDQSVWRMGRLSEPTETEEPVNGFDRNAWGFRTRRLWDGRYWVQLQSVATQTSRLHVRPFQKQHAKAFREALPRDQRRRLEALLRHYAPGKVRYTIPAIYTSDANTQFDKSDGGREPHGLTLQALPTLGIQLPGLSKWLKYEISYKKVDLSLLRWAGRRRRERLVGFRPSHSQSRRRRNSILQQRLSRGRTSDSDRLTEKSPEQCATQFWAGETE